MWCGTMRQGMQVASRTWKRQGMDAPSTSKRNQSYQDLYFSPVTLILDLAPELGIFPGGKDNKIILF